MLYNKTKKEKQTYKLLKSKQRFTFQEERLYVDPYIEILDRNQEALTERLDGFVAIHAE